jgi:hypothetical protein
MGQSELSWSLNWPWQSSAGLCGTRLGWTEIYTEPVWVELISMPGWPLYTRPIWVMLTSVLGLSEVSWHNQSCLSVLVLSELSWLLHCLSWANRFIGSVWVELISVLGLSKLSCYQHWIYLNWADLCTDLSELSWPLYWTCMGWPDLYTGPMYLSWADLCTGTRYT